MNAFPASYFDGITARALPVTLRLQRHDGAVHWHIDGDSFHASHDARTVRITPAARDARRFFHFPDGSSCEAACQENLDTTLASMPGSAKPRIPLSWLETHAAFVATITLLLVLGAAIGVHRALPHLSRQVADNIPPAIERSLGRSTLELLDREVLQPSRTATLRQMEIREHFSELLRKSGYTGFVHLKFRRMYDGTANALALPDGTVVVTDGLIQLAADDDQIMAVLAHELGHLHHRHSLRQLLQNSFTLLLVTSITGDTSAVGNVAAALPLAVLSAKYSRDHEREADAFALALLMDAGIPPGAFIQIMTRIEQDTRRIYQNRPPPFLSTHPPTDERLDTYRKAIDAEKPF